MATLEEIIARFTEPEDINDVARLLSALCVKPLEGQEYYGAAFPSPEAFAVFLTRRPNYLRKVKDAYRDSEFSAFWESFLRDAKTLPMRDSNSGGVTSSVELLESRARHAMTELVSGVTCIPRWNDDNEASSFHVHIESLNLHSANMLDPQVEIHNLGCFSSDPSLNSRVNDIFQSGSNTFLVNSSGTGKTRLLYEGLCQHWGIYLTSVVDVSRLGTHSMENLLRKRLIEDLGFKVDLPESTSLAFKPMISYNIRAVHRYLANVVLTHLLVLRMFVQIALEVHGELSNDHKRRWLVLQLYARILRSPTDIFHKILFDHISLCPELEVMESLREVWGDVQRLCDTPSQGFFFVLDEANYPARAYCGAFRDDEGNYPVLKELLRAWEKNIGLSGATFVVAGTDIPKEYFCGSEWASWRWSSNTGSFGTEEEQRRYILPFFPPPLASSESGKELVRRIWMLCRHRHRFTAAVVAVLLRNQYPNGHRLLREVVQALTRHKLPNSEEWDSLDGTTPYKRVNINFNQFTELFDACSKDTLARATVHEVLLHYFITSQHPPYSYNDRRTSIVRLGMGRFVDADMSQIAMDDPYMLIAGAVWFQRASSESSKEYLGAEGSMERKPKGFFDYDDFLELLKVPTDAPYWSGPLVAWFFARSFAAKKQRLSTLCHFTSPGRAKPNWWARGSQLVVFRRDLEGVSHNVVTASALGIEAPPLAFSARSPADVASWLRHERDAAFCLCPPGCGADGIFALKLFNDKFVWVVWRISGAGSDQSPSTEQVKDDLDGLFPPRMFSATEPDTEDLVNAFSSLPDPFTNKTPVLRVIASFPTEPDLSKAFPSRTPVGKPLIAVLKVEYFRQILDEAVSKDVTEGIVSSVLGKRKSIFDEAETPRKKSWQRKRKTSSSDELPARQTRSSRRLARDTS